ASCIIETANLPRKWRWEACGKIATVAEKEKPSRPEGQRFSRVYVDRGKPVDDSRRVRRQVAAVIHEMPDLNELPSIVPRELGLDLVWSGVGPDWPAFFNRIEVADFLDLITITYRYLTDKRRGGMRDLSANERWVAQVRRIFEAENFGYSIDDAGGVHYRL